MKRRSVRRVPSMENPRVSPLVPQISLADYVSMATYCEACVIVAGDARKAAVGVDHVTGADAGGSAFDEDAVRTKIQGGYSDEGEARFSGVAAAAPGDAEGFHEESVHDGEPGQ